MEQAKKPYDSVFDQDDYYLVQSRLFVDQYLAELGITHEMLVEMPTEEAASILRQALQAAGTQIARIEAMVRLGNRDGDTKMEPPARRHQEDRLAHHFIKGGKKGAT